MPIFHPDHKIADLIFVDPAIITVLNRFDIFLGVGDKSIAEVCSANKLDTTFFTAILNTYLNEDYFPEKIFKSADISTIITYLKKTNTYYREFQLPNIERHFSSLMMHSAQSGNLHLLKKFFTEMSHELLTKIEYDEQKVFPSMLKSEMPTDNNITDGRLVEDKLNDLLSFFVIHLKGDYDVNLCRAVVTALFTLSKDIRQNNRIRERILHPMVEASITHEL